MVLGLSLLDLVSSRMVCNEATLSSLALFSWSLDKRVPYVDVAFLFEVEGFVGKLLTLVILTGVGLLLLHLLLPKTRGLSLGMANSLVPWKEQDKEFSVECKSDGYGQCIANDF